MAKNRSDESGREESIYGRSGDPQERQQSHEQNRPWRETQGYQQAQGQQRGQGQQLYDRGGQGMQQGGQGLSQRGSSGQGFGEFGERSQGWESERGSDFYGGQGFGQGSDRHGQQQDWQRTSQQGEQYDSPGYGAAPQGGRPMQGQQGLGQSLSGGYGGMSGGYGGQQLGYGSGLGQRGFRGMGPKNYTRPDERIREDVCEHLTQDDDLDAREIEIKVEQGAVTLEGTVEERWMKHRAEDIAESCSGVREVENRIRVESGLGTGRSGSESLGRSGSHGEGRGQSSTLGSSGTSGSSGSTPH